MKRGNGSESSRTQVIRLPKARAVSGNGERLDAVAVGRARVVAPVGGLWDSWFDSPGVAADFTGQREQPADQEREAL